MQMHRLQGGKTALSSSTQVAKTPMCSHLVLPAQSHAKVILLEVVPLMSKSIELMSM